MASFVGRMRLAGSFQTLAKKLQMRFFYAGTVNMRLLFVLYLLVDICVQEPTASKKQRTEVKSGKDSKEQVGAVLSV